MFSEATLLSLSVLPLSSFPLPFPSYTCHFHPPPAASCTSRCFLDDPAIASAVVSSSREIRHMRCSLQRSSRSRANSPGMPMPLNRYVLATPAGNAGPQRLAGSSQSSTHSGPCWVRQRPGRLHAAQTSSACCIRSSQGYRGPDLPVSPSPDLFCTQRTCWTCTVLSSQQRSMQLCRLAAFTNVNPCVSI